MFSNKKLFEFYHFKRFLVILLAFSPLYIFFSINVSKKISKHDLEAIKALKVSQSCSNINTYKDELNCFRKIQSAQKNLVKNVLCRGYFLEIGSKEFLNANTGCCFDRARLMEQTLRHYGFKVRHVHLHKTDNIGFANLLIPRTNSHATNEVLSSKGWIGMDSNENFLLLDEDLNPHTYYSAIEKGIIKNFSNVDFYEVPLIYIVGLYSRHGTFFKPYLPGLPELNFNEFFSNINKIKIIKTQSVYSKPT